MFLPSLGMGGLGWRRQGRHPGHQRFGGSGRADLVPKGLLHPWYLAFDSLVVTLAYGVPYLDNEFNLQKSHLLLYIYITTYYSNLGDKKENLPFVTNTGESEGLMPSEINQPQKDKCCLSDLIHELSHFSHV